MPLDDAAVDGVLAVQGPGVQALGVAAEAVFQVGAGAGHEPIERDGDVTNHDCHGRDDPADRVNSSALVAE